MLTHTHMQTLLFDSQTRNTCRKRYTSIGTHRQKNRNKIQRVGGDIYIQAHAVKKELI